jgi:hemoglobin
MASAVLATGAAIALGGALLLACASKPPPKPVSPDEATDVSGADLVPEPPAPPPLYTRLGGADGVSAIVDSFVDNLLADKRLKKAFSHTPKGPKLDHFKQMMKDQICEMTGGGCHYAGKTMSDAHAGMKVTAAQFDAFVQSLQLALEEKQVAKDDEQQLLEQFNLLKDQIATQK